MRRISWVVEDFGVIHKKGLKQEKIASLRKPSITQQSVNRHLRRAGWFAVEKAIRFFEKQLLKAVIPRYSFRGL